MLFKARLIKPSRETSAQRRYYRAEMGSVLSCSVLSHSFIRGLRSAFSFRCSTLASVNKCCSCYNTSERWALRSQTSLCGVHEIERYSELGWKVFNMRTWVWRRSMRCIVPYRRPTRTRGRTVTSKWENNIDSSLERWMRSVCKGNSFLFHPWGLESDIVLPVILSFGC